MRRCPFLKKTIYSSHQNSGGGYPIEWIVHEEFERCIGKRCAAYQFFKNEDTDTIITYCELCGKQNPNVET